MADEAEMAEHQEQLARDIALKHRVIETHEPGVCLSCKEPIDKGRYCNADCRIGHEKYVATLKRTGTWRP